MTFKKIEVYRINRLKRSVNKRGGSALDELLKTDSYLLEYNAEASSLSDEELDEILNGTQGLLRKLKNIDNSLGIIQGN